MACRSSGAEDVCVRRGQLILSQDGGGAGAPFAIEMGYALAAQEVQEIIFGASIVESLWIEARRTVFEVLPDLHNLANSGSCGHDKCGPGERAQFCGGRQLEATEAAREAQLGKGSWGDGGVKQV